MGGGGGDWCKGTGLFKKSYDVESLCFGSATLLKMWHIFSASFNAAYIQAAGCATVSNTPYTPGQFSADSKKSYIQFVFLF